ncbi:MAG: putative Ig domain-containing protein, partial [Verrucomicrobiae bacterium]|nr:putative Ig domain-containing protein [Verrucomicrobiae bacterium]
MLGEQIFLFAWRRADGTALVFAWTSEETTVTLNNSSGLAAMDLFGNRVNPRDLTEYPIIFYSSSQTPAQLMADLMTRLPALNLAPHVQPIPNQTVKVGEPLRFTIAASDLDNDPLTFSLQSPLPGATLDALTGAFTWTPSPYQRGTHTVRVTVTDARGATTSTSTLINVVDSLLDGLVSRWKLDETTGLTAGDSVGTNTGHLVGFTQGATWVPGQHGNGLNFDGTTRCVRLDNSQIRLTNNFTVAVWVKPRKASIGGPLVAFNFIYENSGFWLGINSNRVFVGGRTATRWRVNDFALGQIQDHNWHHIAVVYDKSCWSVYVNGRPTDIGFGGQSCWGEDLVVVPSAVSSFGAHYPPYFDGVLDDVMIFNRTLSPTEILALYQSGNHPPAIIPPGNRTVNEGQLLTFTISGSDPDGDTLTYSASGLPHGAIFDPATKTFTWTPGYTQAGTYNVTFTVSDGSLSASTTITITVNNVNRAPMITSPGNRTVSEGQTLTFTVSGGDPDGDTVTFSASGLPTGATFDAGARTFMWTPSYTQAGTYSVTFTVSDGSLSASTTITITVNNINRAPTITSPGNRTVSVGTNLTLTVSGSDPDGDPLTYSASGLPASATFNPSTRVFSWTPTAGQAGTHSVTFTVSDGNLSASTTVTITVQAVNRPPTIASPGNQTVNEGQTLTFTVSGSDPDGDAVTFSASGLPTGATFDAGARTFTWTPSYTQAGTYSITFTISDGSLAASASITIVVQNVNRPPVFIGGTNYIAQVEELLTFTVSATDPDGDALTYSVSGLPVGATFNTATRVFSWTPSGMQTGAHAVVFSVRDGVATVSALVTVVVQAAATTNRAPELDVPEALLGVVATEVTATFRATDADGDAITLTASGLPSGASLSADGEFRWVPGAHQYGAFLTLVLASDGRRMVGQPVALFITHPNYDWAAGARLFGHRIESGKF